MKKFLLFLVFILISFSFTGCSKLINTEYENVEVNITDEMYIAPYTLYYHTGKTIMPISHAAEYNIVVEYKGIEYFFRDKNTYNKYKDRVGETTTGILEICTYDDGTIKYNITELE